ncbi:MAG: diadenylate cyclase CdaA [Candidatus Omnitrophica bacterium]|nr:diadenylate cyclase CdaA [Candidatus Omnitrophota bacterium]
MIDFINYLRNALDLLLITVAIFFLLRFLKGSRAMHVLYGLLILGGVYLLGQALELQAFTTVVKGLAEAFLIISVIIFQQEIRRGLARLGVAPLFQRVFQADRDLVQDVVGAAYQLAAQRIGALILITRQTGLKTIADRGTKLDAVVSSELIISLFNPYSPLHDGAIIITENRILSAGCLLPLSEREHPKEFGTRHRAGLGITEESDAIAIIVSEERGKVSLAYVGEVIRDMTKEQMIRQVSELMATLVKE